MTRQEQIEFIRQKCIEANPKIKDLVFGCEIERSEARRLYKVIEEEGFAGNPNKVWINSVPFGSMEIPREVDKGEILDEQGETWKIIGRPIRLADVLLALRSKGWVWDTNRVLLENWDLRIDDLTLQSKVTIEFLVGLC